MTWLGETKALSCCKAFKSRLSKNYTVYSLQFTEISLQRGVNSCTVHTVQRTVYSVKCKEIIELRGLNSCTVYSLQLILQHGEIFGFRGLNSCIVYGIKCALCIRPVARNL